MNFTTQTYDINGVQTSYSVMKGMADTGNQEAIVTNQKYNPYTQVTVEKKLVGTIYSEDRQYVFHLHYLDKDPEPDAPVQNSEKVIPIIINVKVGEQSGAVIYNNLPVGVPYYIHEADEASLVSLGDLRGYTVEGVPPDEEHRFLNGETERVLQKQSIDYKKHFGQEYTVVSQCDNEFHFLAGAVSTRMGHAYSFTNQRPNSITVKKQDINGVPLIGAGFTLYDEQGSIVKVQK